MGGESEKGETGIKEPEVKDKINILWILKETKEAVKKKDIIKLKDLSNHTIHTASIEQDSDSISIAVIIYALSKIIERQKYRGWDKFYQNFMVYINEAISFLRKNKIKEFREEIKRIREEMDNLSGDLKKQIQDVFRKAQINKASRVYEHGISMEQTAKLLGITLWELAEYAGQTGISDVNLTITMPIKKRIKLAEDIFKK